MAPHRILANFDAKENKILTIVSWLWARIPLSRSRCFANLKLSGPAVAQGAERVRGLQIGWSGS
jgi:hypothetical protein